MSIIDYSDGPIPASALRAAGVTGVVRYVTLGSSDKHISTAELAALRAGGIDVALVAERDARTLASATWDAAAAARAIRADCASLGYSGAVYQAVDWDVQSSEWPRVRDHLRQIIGVMGVERTGVYGPWDALEWAHRDLGTRLLWQSMSAAHSGGRNAHQHPRAVLWQRRRSAVGGVPVDLNDTIASDWGQERAAEMTFDEWKNGTVAGDPPAGMGGPDTAIRMADWVGYTAGTLSGLAVAMKVLVDQATALTAKVDALDAKVGLPVSGDVSVSGTVHLGATATGASGE